MKKLRALFKKDQLLYLKAAIRALSLRDIPEILRLKYYALKGKLEYRFIEREKTDELSFFRIFQSKWDTENLVEFLRKEKREFFVSDRGIKAVRERCPEHVERLIHQAEKISEGRFSFLGSGELKFEGCEIPWHTDVKSGYEWDRNVYFRRVPYGHMKGVDVKVPWEMSRLQFLPQLAIVYLITGEEKYAEKIIKIFEHWCRENPPRKGVNWACTMDVAIRYANFTFAVLSILNSKHITEDFVRLFLNIHAVHADHIFKYLERKLGLTTNHYMADICGLLVGSLPFREIPFYGRKIRFALKELSRQVKIQFREDGMNFESSSYYHAFVLEMVVYALIFVIKSGLSFPGDVKVKIQKALEFLHAVTSPDGKLIQIGDTDSGKFFTLFPRDIRDFSHVEHLGKVVSELYDDVDVKVPEVKLFFPELQENERIYKRNEKQLFSFTASGVHVWRDARIYFAFYNVPQGSMGIGNHNHNDRLSFVFFVAGEEIFTDPGTYVYTPYPEWRNKFRSTMYHNTVSVNGEEQSPFPEFSLFLLYDEAAVESTAHIEDGRIIFHGKHTGYRRRFGVVHARTIELFPGKNRVHIKDYLEGENEGVFEAKVHFHLAPGVEVKRKNSNELIIIGDRVEIKLNLNGIENVKIYSAWFSPSYGVKVQTKAVDGIVKSPLPLSIDTTIEWYNKETSALEEEK